MNKLKYLLSLSIISTYYFNQAYSMEVQQANVPAQYQFIIEHYNGSVKDAVDGILLTAIGKKDLSTVKWAVQNGARLSYPKKPRSFGPPLADAVQTGDISIVKYLLEKGAPVNQVNRYGKTPKEIASGMGYSEILKLLNR